MVTAGIGSERHTGRNAILALHAVGQAVIGVEVLRTALPTVIDKGPQLALHGRPYRGLRLHAICIDLPNAGLPVEISIAGQVDTKSVGETTRVCSIWPIGTAVVSEFSASVQSPAPVI